MKDIPMVLEAHVLTVNASRIVYIGDDPPPFFLGREPLYEHIALVGHEPMPNLVSVLESEIGRASCRERV